jgi:hypothetical protein
MTKKRSSGFWRNPPPPLQNPGSAPETTEWSSAITKVPKQRLLQGLSKSAIYYYRKLFYYFTIIFDQIQVHRRLAAMLKKKIHRYTVTHSKFSKSDISNTNYL